MEIIATLPPPHAGSYLYQVASHPKVSAARYNIGMRTPHTVRESLEIMLDAMRGKPLWIDLKGRQLRIVQWSEPLYGEIIVSHNFQVDLPAELILRGSQSVKIKQVVGNKIFVFPAQPYAVGAGQAVNVHGSGLEIEGFLTEEDVEFISIARELGIHRYMLSFVEREQDILDVLALDPQAEIVAKIESVAGVDFVASVYDKYRENVRLMAARDDLYINTPDSKLDIFKSIGQIISHDPFAIVASRILESLRNSATPSLGDLSDLFLMYRLGFRRFMLSDGLSLDENAFSDAMNILSEFIEKVEEGK